MINVIFLFVFQATGGVESSMLIDSGTPVESSVSVIGGARGSAGGTVPLYYGTLTPLGRFRACL